MTPEQIARALTPFVPASLPAALPERLSVYLELLLKWNSRVNLTAIRGPEEIVARHFGESLFAAAALYPTMEQAAGTLIDLGSGAGFPGLPIKLWAPPLSLTLIEAQQKKSVFLKEVVRALELEGVEVYSGRAEEASFTAETVTLRAVEKFADALPVAAGLVAEGGRLALLVGSEQVAKAEALLPGWKVAERHSIPQSRLRQLAILQNGERLLNS